jgi:hypothetical protein
VMMDCKPVLLGVLLQLMFFQRLLNLAVRSEWFLRSSNPCVAMVFPCAPFLCCLSSAISKLRWTKHNQRKTTIAFFIVILRPQQPLVVSCNIHLKVFFPLNDTFLLFQPKNSSFLVFVVSY